MWFNEETGKWEKFGTSPVPISKVYLKLVGSEEDGLIRDLIASTAYEFVEVPPELDDAIWIDFSGEEIIYSKGWKDFFKYEL